ncbi:hypothetical protein DFH29DRAFT_887148 [Suillus ampliporus]|nr:hypothetical protein DFH29DRAFT_958294 [Suillus ampliporus]KAG0709232.1 hypothetical protein DFH29DRAFT_887148 [Suillus ampliporus]
MMTARLNTTLLPCLSPCLSSASLRFMGRMINLGQRLFLYARFYNRFSLHALSFTHCPMLVPPFDCLMSNYLRHVVVTCYRCCAHDL